MIFFNINCVAEKSAITPSFKGLTAFISVGVLPNISFASKPVAKILPFFLSIATTEGSFNTIPLPFNVTNKLAVPKSIPISFEVNPNILFNLDFLAIFNFPQSFLLKKYLYNICPL